MVIKPRTSLLAVDFGELWRYRDLCAMLVRRDIVTMYKQTILGPLWFFIQPIMTTVMYMVVFQENYSNVGQIITKEKMKYNVAAHDIDFEIAYLRRLFGCSRRLVIAEE